MYVRRPRTVDLGDSFGFVGDPHRDRKTGFKVRSRGSPRHLGGARTGRRPALAKGPRRRRDLGSHRGARSPHTESRASTGSRVARSSRPTRADALPPSSTRHASRTRGPGSPWRSEEHTSELQSRLHLVCRLLLEKKTTGSPNFNNYGDDE